MKANNLYLEKQTVFSLFCFFCIFAQGFSLKMQLVEQKTWFWTRFIPFLESKTLKTLILDRFLSEHTIKPMLFQHFAFLRCDSTIKHNRYLQQTPTTKSRNRDLQWTLTMDTIDAYHRHLQQTLTMDTCNRHLQQTLTIDTIDTYNRHLQQTLTMDTYNRYLQQTLAIDTYIVHYTHQVTF